MFDWFDRLEEQTRLTGGPLGQVNAIAQALAFTQQPWFFALVAATGGVMMRVPGASFWFNRPQPVRFSVETYDLFA